MRKRISCDQKKNSLLRPLLNVVPGSEDRPAERPGVVVEPVERGATLLGVPEAALNSPLELVAVERVVAFVERCASAKVFDPLRVTTAIVAPELRPYSAWKLDA